MNKPETQKGLNEWKVSVRSISPFRKDYVMVRNNGVYVKRCDAPAQNFERECNLMFFPVCAEDGLSQKGMPLGSYTCADPVKETAADLMANQTMERHAALSELEWEDTIAEVPQICTLTTTRFVYSVLRNPWRERQELYHVYALNTNTKKEKRLRAETGASEMPLDEAKAVVHDHFMMHGVI